MHNSKCIIFGRFCVAKTLWLIEVQTTKCLFLLRFSVGNGAPKNTRYSVFLPKKPLGLPKKEKGYNEIEKGGAKNFSKLLKNKSVKLVFLSKLYKPFTKKRKTFKESSKNLKTFCRKAPKNEDAQICFIFRFLV